MARAAVKPSRQTLTLLAVLAGVGLLVCAGIYAMGSAKLSKLTVQLESRRKAVEESKRIAERLEQAEMKYRSAESQVSFLENSVSTRDFIPTLLKQLERLGKSHNLRVLSVKPRLEQAATQPSRRDPAAQVEGDANSNDKQGENKPERKPYDSLTIDIEVTGTYANLMAFLNGITSFPKILEVNALQITPTTQCKSFGSPELSMQINVTAYIFPVAGDSHSGDNLKPVETEPKVSKAGDPIDRRSSNELG